ncbi:MAG: dienelactone hydrolase family protein [Kofleriaceae bacterium]
MADMIDIATQDGVCAAYVFRPAGPGPWPAVLFYMDGLGIRPALFDMAGRLSDRGYYVLLPDLYYRSGPYAPMDAKQVFSDPAQRQLLSQNYLAKLGQANAMRDTSALLAYLAAQPDVAPGKLAAIGYCMGGGLAIAAAANFPDRISAVAAYHPGNLATDAPDSPHLLAPRLEAKLYIGRASEDPSFPDAMKDRLEAALGAAGVAYTLETYPARHGWVPTDTPVHDAAAAERHWETLFALLESR